MGKASSAKKVARVARTGGGRTRRGQSTSWFWPVFVGLVVVLGTAGIVYSKDQRQPDNSRPRAGGSGRAGDHWHAAIGFDICGTFAPNISDQTDVSGIHTHGDGVVHVHPFSQVAAGKRATLGVFFKTVKATVSSSEVRLPGQPAKKDGDKCGDKPGQVQVRTWPSRNPDAKPVVFSGDPSDVHPKDGELITIAFVPKGAEIPRPPSADQLDKLNDLGTTSTTSTTVAGGTPSSTGPPPSGGETTIVPSTSAPATTTPSTTAPTQPQPPSAPTSAP
jgi:hypothetical protein